MGLCGRNMFFRAFFIFTVLLLSGCKAFERAGIRATNAYQIKENKLILPPDMYECPVPEGPEDLPKKKQTKS
ncbi:MAG: hypothetical protein LBI30_00115 [Holosporales bacterium]|jgi:hypothetical protein|nr:hypothetical protein [Holosporales bacterium]